MENASNALLMAGGILLAIVVISIFILSYNNIVNMKEAELQQEIFKEVEYFNAPFLAFNKKVMYGTDVISILNFAIDNNRKNNVTIGEDCYVDVSFKLTKDSIQDRVYLYTLNRVTSIYEKDDITGTIEATKYGAIEQQFLQGREYRLSANFDGIKAFLMTAEREEETKTIQEKIEGTEIVSKYSIRYSGIADFKRKTFKCSGVELGPDGRVNSMIFEQIKASKY